MAAWNVIAVVAGLAVLLAACGGSPTGAPSVPSEPLGASDAGSRDAAAAPGEVAHELLGVQQSAGEMGVVEHAADEARYAELWERFSFEKAAPAVDFDEYVVLFYARPEDGCPDEIGDVHLEGDRLVVDWRPPAGGCIEPLIPTAFAIAVHRATVPQTFVALLEGFAGDDDIEHVVEIPAYEGAEPGDAPARPAPPEPTTVTGTVQLPPQGQAAAGTLDDGTRVWVIHHDDGAVSVLAADAVTDVGSETLVVSGLHTQVGWYPSARRFSGGGWYDEYGVSLRGRSGSNLDWYELAVNGPDVTVGRRVGPVPFQRPLSDGAGAGDSQPELPDHPREATAVPLDEARQRPDGSVVVIDAALVAYGDQPIRLCVAPEPPELWDWRGCPSDAPTPVDITVDEVDAEFMWVWHGPLRARVTDGGFADVTLLGAGHSGGRIDS